MPKNNFESSIEEMLKETDGEEELEVEEKVEEEEKPDKYEEHLDKLAKDEQEAIDAYDKAIEELEEKEIVEELKRIREEEVAHLEFLKRAKTDKNARYEEPKGE